MKKATLTRAQMLGNYISENKSTVREAAKEFHISKSTVHKDVTGKLRDTDPELFDRVRRVLETNKAERHLRGGLATKRKYMQKRHERQK